MGLFAAASSWVEIRTDGAVVASREFGVH